MPAASSTSKSQPIPWDLQRHTPLANARRNRTYAHRRVERALAKVEQLQVEAAEADALVAQLETSAADGVGGTA